MNGFCGWARVRPKCAWPMRCWSSASGSPLTAGRNAINSISHCHNNSWAIMSGCPRSMSAGPCGAWSATGFWRCMIIWTSEFLMPRHWPGWPVSISRTSNERSSPPESDRLRNRNPCPHLAFRPCSKPNADRSAVEVLRHLNASLFHDLPQRFARQMFGILLGDPVNQQDPEQTFRLVADRQAANLMVPHGGGCILDRLAVEAGQHFGAHDVPHPNMHRRLVAGDETHHDIAIGDHADKPVMVQYGQDTDIPFAHHLCRGGNAGRDRDGNRRLSYDVSYLHINHSRHNSRRRTREGHPAPTLNLLVCQSPLAVLTLHSCPKCRAWL